MEVEEKPMDKVHREKGLAGADYDIQEIEVRVSVRVGLCITLLLFHHLINPRRPSQLLFNFSQNTAWFMAPLFDVCLSLSFECVQAEYERREAARVARTERWAQWRDRRCAS